MKHTLIKAKNFIQQNRRLVAAVLFAFVVGYLLFLAIPKKTLPQQITQAPPAASIISSQSANTTQEQLTLQEKYLAAKALYPDTVAFLNIENSDISEPVLQKNNNEYYLTHNEKGEYDIYGCYYADYENSLKSATLLSQNTIIYGHSEPGEKKDGAKFTQLFAFLETDFVQENSTITLNIEDEQLAFEVFAVFFTSTDFYYIDANPSSQGFASFIASVAAKSEYKLPFTVADSDKLLTLSTCAYRYDKQKTGEHRLVVMARLVNGEPQGHKYERNKSPQRP